LLLPRDPHCLYAHWDLTLEQQQRFNGLAAHRHLLIRVYRDALGGPKATELHVHPESRHWFVHVEQAGTRYVAELGYYQPGGEWKQIAASEPVSVPREGPAEDKTVQFATFSHARPPARALPPLVIDQPQLRRDELPRVPISQSEPRFSGVQAIAPQTGRFPQPAIEHYAPSFSSAPPPAPWTAAQEHALAELLETCAFKREWIGSPEIAELLRSQNVREQPQAISSLEVTLPPGEVLSSPGAEQISSPMPAEALPGKAFWFNVNAELIIYGATEPDAVVTIGGRPIRLRTDGTFSYRFALPDGTYKLPIAAAAAHGESRRADLEFLRVTCYAGEVGRHPQDPNLKPPQPGNVI
jgi:hypothetical protein